MFKRKIFRELKSVSEATEIFYKYCPNEILSSETIPLLASLGRVLANNIFSPIDIPPFDRASMDGFAVIAEDTIGSMETNAITLDVIGSVKAGYTFDKIVNKGLSVEIATGAPLPAGTNCVVMVEYTKRNEDKVDIFQMVTPGENVTSAGADIQSGELILQERTLLTSRELSVLAAMGYDKIDVIKKPRVGIFSSGDEIISLGGELSAGKLYDINSTAIAANILENGGDPHILGIIEDDFEQLETQISKVLTSYDLLIVSGGTSAGMGDILYNVVDKLGTPGLLVHGIKVKPGKPTILAVCDGVPVIGLPGYPASALSIHMLFVLPYIRSIAGLSTISESSKLEATIKQRIRSVTGRYEFKPMNIIKSEEGWLAFPVPGGSGAITSIALADGFIEIPEDISFLLPETKVSISLFSDKIKPYSIQIIGSHCIALAHLQSLYSSKFPNYSSRSIAIGSSGGVSAIRRGEAHIAGIHILDAEKGYNLWLEEKIDAIIIPGYFRMQGLIVKKGNPKNIISLKDLKKKNVRFMNRNQGSGTRILLDKLLVEENIKKEEINGYNHYGKSHTSVASAVNSDLVDVTIGIESAVTPDLEFIELFEEEYDFLINKKYFSLKPVQDFIKTIQSEEFKNILTKLPGFRSKAI